MMREKDNRMETEIGVVRRKAFSWLIGLAILMLFLSVILSSASYSNAEIISSDRRVTWEGNAGVSGGIPDRTVICATLDSGASSSQINNAIASCPSGQVVYLNPGTYNLNDTIYMKSDVTLRGAGPGTPGSGAGGTRLIIRLPGGTGGNIAFYGTGSDSLLSTDENLKVDAVKGNTHVYLDSNPGWITVGETYGIDQLDDSSFVTSEGQEGGASYREIMNQGTRGLSQIVLVTSTETDATGFKVNFEMPLAYGFKTAYTAQIFRINNPSIKNAGIEDLYVESGWSANETTVHQFKIQAATNCWIKNIESNKSPGGAHVWTFFPYRFEIRDSYFHDSFYFGGGQGYGTALYHGATGCLIENNIYNRLHTSMEVQYGGAYNVFGYNYELAGHSDSGQNPSMGAHGTHAYMVLFEGNSVYDRYLGDYTHGSASNITLLRNYIPVPGDSPAIWLDKYNRYYNIVGNVLGNNSSQNTYMIRCGIDSNSTCNNSDAVYTVGWDQLCNAGAYGGCDTNMTTIDSTHTLIHGNFDYVNDSVQWDSGISDHAIPDSYYYSSKPAFFGNLSWPPIGPDLNPMAGTIPAKLRFEVMQAIPAPPENLRVIGVQ